MKKLFYIVLLSLLSLSSVSASWYGNHAAAYSTSPNIQNCDTDGDDAGVGDPAFGHRAVANNNSTTTLTPETVRYGVAISGNMRCLYWDDELPTVVSINHFDGWTNQTAQNVSFSLQDTGGADLSSYTLQHRIYNGGIWGVWTNIAGYTNKSISGANYNSSYPYTGVNSKRYQYRIQVRDTAGNISPWGNSGKTTMVDTQAPVIGDVTVPSTNLLADDNYFYQLNIAVAGGSPIDHIKYKKENTNNNLLGATVTDILAPWNFSWNISKVDNFRIANGARVYTFQLREVCDEAGNCWTGAQNYNHNVYANTLNIVSSTLINTLLGSIVADGTQKNIRVHLEDNYTNDIVPASGIGRNIDFNIRVDNALRRDQYTNTGTDSALFIGNNTNPVSITSNSLNSLNNQTSGDGSYDIPFYVYAPTSNSDALTPGFANITSVSFDVDRTASIAVGDNPQDQDIPSASNTSIQAESMYSTLYNPGSDLKLYSFLEGTPQSSQLTVSKNSFTARNSINKNIYLEFGSPSALQLELTANLTSGNAIVTEAQDYASQFQSNIGFVGNNKGLDTFLTANGVVDLSKAYLATIIRYTLDGKIITYPSDIINKSAYHDIVYTGGASQSGIKVIGNVSSQNTQELITDQFSDDVRILGELTKSSFRRDIQRKVYAIIRNLQVQTIGSTILGNLRMNMSTWNNTGIRANTAISDKVLYFGDMSGGNVEITGASNIEGVKTLIVEGGNIYISGDIKDTDNDAILGLIAIAKDGFGGNIYIDPLVGDIHAIIYADKSVISYDGVELDGNNTVATSLANQLYIKGAIFSENTVGASRATPITCPYYVLNSDCNSSQKAQKYDLNYLRRYFIYDSNSNGTIEYNGADSPANGGAWSNGGNTNIFRKYPVIIDYNPRIQQSPPPFFD